MEFIEAPDNVQEILAQETLPDGTKIATHHCWATRLAITGDAQVAAGVELPLSIAFQDWHGQALSANRQIAVTVAGPEQSETTLTPSGGQAVFNFQADTAGVYTVRASAAAPNFGCDDGMIEVTVA